MNAIRIAKSKVDFTELTRKAKRIVDSNFSYRRLFLFMLGVCMSFYLLPPIFRYIFVLKSPKKDPLLQCMDDCLTPFFLQSLEYDANIRHVPPLPEEYNAIPYVGNGYIGVQVAHNAALNIKSGRSIQFSLPVHPIISVSHVIKAVREATVVDYLSGIVYRFQCTPNYFVAYSYYAHRRYSSILMQEIKITNMHNKFEDIVLSLPRILLQSALTRTLHLSSSPQLKQGAEYIIVTGTVKVKPEDASNSDVIVVSIVLPKMSPNIQLKKWDVTKIIYPIAIHYSKPTNPQKIKEVTDDTETKVIEAMKKVAQKLNSSSRSDRSYRQEHVNVWRDLWATGFSISTSKASPSLNGDRINATIYAVLSQVRSYEFEEMMSVSAPSKQDIAKALTYAEGCYDSYHTLQAENLWKPMNSLGSLNDLVSSWLLTLEKQGCHNLIRAGASGVIQAMVLSFGSFRFSNQHLECNMHPKYLHRDFHFRRLNYGNMTHVNVSITVTEDNKAVINVALDRSDRRYFACDGGCLDEPVQLTQAQRQFPVKLTEPLTAILYITEDKQHMEELHEAIHVKEVVEAPAHEQHVIALHRHGNRLGGLPTFFWISFCSIIVVFHIFLCKLIIKEYCEPVDKPRYRYNKP